MTTFAEEAYDTIPETGDNFLKQLSGAHNCVFFNPERGRGPVDAMTTTDPQDVLSRLAGLGDVNAYFMVNEPKPGSPHKKLMKENVGRICAVWADLDPQVDVGLDRARELLLEKALEVKPKPTCINDSGGGYQLFWFLKEPVFVTPAAIKMAEAIGEEIAFKLDGDAVYNIDRIMRLPFTENIPDASKLKKGRIRRPTQIVDWTGLRYTLDELAGFFPTTPDRPSKGDKVTEEDVAAIHIDVAAASSVEAYDHLPSELRERLESLRKEEAFTFLWGGKKSEGDTSGSGMLASLVVRLRRAEFNPTEIAMIARVWQPCWGTSRAKNTAPRALRRVIAKADLWIKEKSKNKPVIELKVSELAQAAVKIEQIMVEAGLEIYQRGNSLVRPVIVPYRNRVTGEETEVGKLGEFPSNYLASQLMDQVATFKRWKGDEDKGKYVSIDAPSKLANLVLARSGHWKFKHGNGIILGPTLRPDGSILATQGYDPPTGIYVLEVPSLPLIPDKPTKAQAKAALLILLELVKLFPFVSRLDQAIALSCIMSVVLRPALDITPMHAISAPKPNSGKSLWIHCCAMIATGRMAPVTTPTSEGKELDKEVRAAMLDASPILFIDNVPPEMVIYSAVLCTAIDQQRLSIRQMMTLKDKTEIEQCCSLFMTGNNLTISRDMVRRTLLARLDTKEEKPWLIDFTKKPDPLWLIAANRGKYLAAVLTIARAVFVNEEEIRKDEAVKKMLPYSFKLYARLIQTALVWLGEKDPIEGIEVLYESDPALGTVQAIHEEWEKAFGLGGKTKRSSSEVAHLVNESVRNDDPDAIRAFKHKYPELYEVLLSVAKADRGMDLDPQKLGNRLGTQRDDIVGDYVFRRTEKRTGGHFKWWLAKASLEPKEKKLF